MAVGVVGVWARAVPDRRLAGTRAKLWAVLVRSRLVTAALVILAIVALTAVFADALAPYAPSAQAGAQRLQGPSPAHLLGTDDLGRDTLSRVIFGARVALTASLLAVTVALVLGVPL